MPKIEKICILYIYWEYLLCMQSNASGSFLQICINFVERLKFSHFEGSIIPKFFSAWGDKTNAGYELLGGINTRLAILVHFADTFDVKIQN